MLYPIFYEKSIGNGLRYVRGLQVMLIDVDNVNQAESHKWVHHIKKHGQVIFKKNTYDTCFISNFSREIIGNGLRYVRGLQGMLSDIDDINQAMSHK